MPFGVFYTRWAVNDLLTDRRRSRIAFSLVRLNAGFDRAADGSLSYGFAAPWIEGLPIEHTSDGPTDSKDQRRADGLSYRFRRGESPSQFLEPERLRLVARAAELTAAEQAQPCATGGYFVSVRWAHWPDKAGRAALPKADRRRQNFIRLYLVQRSFNWRRDTRVDVQLGNIRAADHSRGFARLIARSPVQPWSRMAYHARVLCAVARELTALQDGAAGFPAAALAAADRVSARLTDPAYWAAIEAQRDSVDAVDAVALALG
jgi:hypothetical protein